MTTAAAAVEPKYDYWYWYDLRMWLLQRDGKCRYCKCELNKRTVTIDHLVPRSKGGSNDDNNVVACCSECNNKKGDMLPDEFLALLKKDEHVKSGDDAD